MKPLKSEAWQAAEFKPAALRNSQDSSTNSGANLMNGSEEKGTHEVSNSRDSSTQTEQVSEQNSHPEEGPSQSISQIPESIPQIPGSKAIESVGA